MSDIAAASAPAGAAHDVRASLAQRKVEREEVKRLRATARAAAVANEAAGAGDGSSRVVTAAQFWATFDAAILRLKSELACIPASAPAPFLAALDDFTCRTRDLQRLLNECVSVLPPYDVAKAQTGLERLKSDISAARAEMAPRPRFRFNRRATHAVTTSTSAAPPRVATSTVDMAEHAIERLEGRCVLVTTSTVSIAALDDSHEVQVESRVKSSDLRLTDLKRCVVCITGTLRALRMDGLSHCQLYLTCVDGSLLLHDCDGVEVHTPARQVRIHGSRQCAFYLNVPSRPIIETCTSLSFAPYDLKGGSTPGGGENVWSQVQDFDWLRSQASPNWRVLPLEERVVALPAHVLAHGFQLMDRGLDDTTAATAAAAATPAPTVAAGAVMHAAATLRVKEEDDEL